MDLQPQPEPFIYDRDEQSVYVQFPDGSRQGFVLRCNCGPCTSIRNKIDLPRLLAAWTDNRVAREETIRRRMAAKEAANAKARDLFLRLLTDEERNEFLKHNYVYFKGQKGVTYRLQHGYSGNISKPSLCKSYCCYLNAPVPIYDHMIGQYLALKYNEDLFLQKAY